MFRAGFTLFRRLISAAVLLILLICGAEVVVRVCEGLNGLNIRSSDPDCRDPSKLAIPSWSFHQELKPLATARVECRDSNAEIEVRTNSLGLRAIEPVIPKPSTVYRIVVLGDETIYAPEIADSEHFCTLLQNLVQQQTRMKVEVINAGVPGHCPLTEYLLFKQRLLSLQPDLLLLHFDWSDVMEDRQIRRNALCDESGIPQSCPNAKLAMTKKVLKHEVWRQQFRLLDWAMSAASREWKQQLAQQKAVSRDVDANPYAWLRDERPQQNVSFRESVHPIVDLAQLCRLSSCQFAVMTSPKPWQVSAKCSRGEGVRLAEGVAREACFSNREPFRVLARFAQNKFPFLDGSSVLASGPDAEANFLRYAARWSPAGHRRMAKQVASFLVENVAGPWISGPRNSSDFYSDPQQPTTRTERRENPIQWTNGQQTGRSDDSRFRDREPK